MAAALRVRVAPGASAPSWARHPPARAPGHRWQRLRAPALCREECAAHATDGPPACGSRPACIALMGGVLARCICMRLHHARDVIGGCALRSSGSPNTPLAGRRRCGARAGHIHRARRQPVLGLGMQVPARAGQRSRGDGGRRGARRRTRRASRTTSTGWTTLTGRRWARSRWATRCLRRRLRSTASSGSRRRPSVCCWTTRRTWTARWSMRSRCVRPTLTLCWSTRLRAPAQRHPARRQPALRHPARRPHSGPQRSRPKRTRGVKGAGRAIHRRRCGSSGFAAPGWAGLGVRGAHGARRAPSGLYAMGSRPRIYP